MTLRIVAYDIKWSSLTSLSLPEVEELNVECEFGDDLFEKISDVLIQRYKVAPSNFKYAIEK